MAEFRHQLWAAFLGSNSTKRALNHQRCKSMSCREVSPEAWITEVLGVAKAAVPPNVGDVAEFYVQP